MGGGGDDGASRLDSVTTGHVQVHQQHVGLELEGTVNRLLAVDGLAHQFETVDGGQQGGDALPEVGRVVGNQDPERLPHRQLRRGRALMAVSVLVIRIGHRARHRINRARSTSR